MNEKDGEQKVGAGGTSPEGAVAATSSTPASDPARKSTPETPEEPRVSDWDVLVAAFSPVVMFFAGVASAGFILLAVLLVLDDMMGTPELPRSAEAPVPAETRPLAPGEEGAVSEEVTTAASEQDAVIAATPQPPEAEAPPAPVVASEADPADLSLSQQDAPEPSDGASPEELAAVEQEPAQEEPLSEEASQSTAIAEDEPAPTAEAAGSAQPTDDGADVSGSPADAAAGDESTVVEADLADETGTTASAEALSPEAGPSEEQTALANEPAVPGDVPVLSRLDASDDAPALPDPSAEPVAVPSTTVATLDADVQAATERPVGVPRPRPVPPGEAAEPLPTPEIADQADPVAAAGASAAGEAETTREAGPASGEAILAEAPDAPDAGEIAEPKPELSRVAAGPAWEVHAVPFDEDGALPLVTVLLEFDDDLQIAPEGIFSLGLPLSLAIIPRNGTVAGRKAADFAKAARGAGIELVAHLPMEPKGSADPGPEAIRVGMTSEEAAEQARKLIDRLPGAVAASNFMGSRATEDRALMEAVITALDAEGLGFIDTRTTRQSQALDVAKRLGAAHARNSRFIPEDADEAQVYRLMERAAFDARQRGGALVVAKATLGVLRGLQRWGLERNGRQVRLAPVSALLRSEQGR